METTWLWLIAIVVGIAVVMGMVAALQPDPERVLARESRDWTARILVRSYPANKNGRVIMQAEAGILDRHGYRLVSQTGSGGILHRELTATFELGD